MGLHVTADMLVAPLLVKLRRKLLLWDSVNLSLASRVLVANQVLLASIWYVASTTLFARSCILQVQRLIRNYIWGGITGQGKRPKVAWVVLIAPRQNGGLGLVDPEAWCKALLSKFVCRAMLPMQGVWSSLMMHRLSTMCLTIGGMWQPSLRWAFIQNFHLFKTTLLEDRFFNGILTSWSAIKKFLVRKVPSTTDDLLRQPLTWNFLFSDARGFLLGSRPRLNWAALDASIACNVLSWGCHVMSR